MQSRKEKAKMRAELKEKLCRQATDLVFAKYGNSVTKMGMSVGRVPSEAQRWVKRGWISKPAATLFSMDRTIGLSLQELRPDLFRD